jgi:hypothetical protein
VVAFIADREQDLEATTSTWAARRRTTGGARGLGAAAASWTADTCRRGSRKG